ncbi:hypothetical protein A2U01_0089133, partial [Trifolium medium]
MQGEE